MFVCIRATLIFFTYKFIEWNIDTVEVSGIDDLFCVNGMHQLPSHAFW